MQLGTRHITTALGGLDAAWNAPHHHGSTSGTTWMQLRVRPPALGLAALLGPAPCHMGCSLLRARQALGGLDAAWNAPHHHGPRSGTTWMQLRVRPPCSARLTATARARGQARLGAALGAAALLCPGPCQLGCSLLGACQTLGGWDAAWKAPRPEVRHDLDAASGCDHPAMRGPVPVSPLRGGRPSAVLG